MTKWMALSAGHDARLNACHTLSMPGTCAEREQSESESKREGGDEDEVEIELRLQHAFEVQKKRCDVRARMPHVRCKSILAVIRGKNRYSCT